MSGCGPGIVRGVVGSCFMYCACSNNEIGVRTPLLIKMHAARRANCEYDVCWNQLSDRRLESGPWIRRPQHHCRCRLRRPSRLQPHLDPGRPRLTRLSRLINPPPFVHPTICSNTTAARLALRVPSIAIGPHTGRALKDSWHNTALHRLRNISPRRLSQLCSLHI